MSKSDIEKYVLSQKYDIFNIIDLCHESGDYSILNSFIEENPNHIKMIIKSLFTKKNIDQHKNSLIWLISYMSINIKIIEIVEHHVLVDVVAKLLNDNNYDMVNNILQQDIPIAIVLPTIFENNFPIEQSIISNINTDNVSAIISCCILYKKTYLVEHILRNFPTTCPNSYMYQCIAEGNVEMIELMFKHLPNPSQHNMNVWLGMACKGHNTTITNIFIDHGAKFTFDVNSITAENTMILLERNILSNSQVFLLLINHIKLNNIQAANYLAINYMQIIFDLQLMNNCIHNDKLYNWLLNNWQIISLKPDWDFLIKLCAKKGNIEHVQMCIENGAIIDDYQLTDTLFKCIGHDYNNKAEIEAIIDYIINNCLLIEKWPPCTNNYAIEYLNKKLFQFYSTTIKSK